MASLLFETSFGYESKMVELLNLYALLVFFEKWSICIDFEHEKCFVYAEILIENYVNAMRPFYYKIYDDDNEWRISNLVEILWSIYLVEKCNEWKNLYLTNIV